MRLKALQATWMTLTGTNQCFSVKASNKKEYRIVNFYHDNLEKSKAKFPIEIETIGKHTAIINDHKIDNEFYNDRFCEICCPHSLLPDEQKRAIARDFKSGRRKIKGETEIDGVKYQVIEYDFIFMNILNRYISALSALTIFIFC